MAETKTDMQRFDDLFKSVGITLTKEINKQDNWQSLSTYECTGADGLEAVGYAGFEYEFRFDLSGKLIGMGGFE